jgi:ferredoxin--NADP+ reductase
MFQIVEEKTFNPQVKLLTFKAALIAAKALPGQFVMIRVSETGERIPLTIADYDRAEGTVTIIFQIVGATTLLLAQKKTGDLLLDVAGPLGRPSELDGVKRACLVGGGLGCAISYPQAKYLYARGADVDIIAGFRNAELIFLEDEMRAVSRDTFVRTDDGSNGAKGLVTDELSRLIGEGRRYDVVVAIGPLIMMKRVSELTQTLGIKTVVSLNSIMIDGTGMCGCCRVTVAGETRFACVDGPDFDGHLVDYDEAMSRTAFYREEEAESLKRHKCALGLAAKGSVD